MIGRHLAIRQCKEPRDISPTHRLYRDGLAHWTFCMLATASLALIPQLDARMAYNYAARLMALRKRANRRRMAKGLAPWCVLCGAECHYDNNDCVRHTSGTDSTHKARI